jgi:hypothetical protein
VTPPILPGNIPSYIFGKILFTALVCVLVYFQFKLVFRIKGCGKLVANLLSISQHNDLLSPLLLKLINLALGKVYIASSCCF